MPTISRPTFIPSQTRPGGKAWISLPADQMRVPAAGLGEVSTSGGSGWCSGLVRANFVRLALSYAGCQPLTACYAEAIDPLDTPQFQADMNKPFGLGGASSCGMFARIMLWRAGLKDPRFTVPYSDRISYAISDILNIGRENGGYIPYSVTGPQPKPGDILYLSGAPNGGFEHVGIFVKDNGNGTWTTVDGGQPGIEERIRTMQSNGIFANDGRELTAFVSLETLPLPCPIGSLVGMVAAVGLGVAAGLALASYGMKAADGAL